MSNQPVSPAGQPRVAPRIVGATAVTLAGGTLFSGGLPAHAASLVVTNLNESGAGSLADVIDQANAAPGLDTITFDVQGTITLTGSYALPGIVDDVIIQGPGSGLLTIDGDGVSCDILRNWDPEGFTWPYGAPVDITVSGITVSGSDCDSIDIAGANSLTLTDVVSTQADFNGLFVLNVPTITVSDSDFSNNGQGIYLYAWKTEATADPILRSTVTLSNVTANSNTDYGAEIRSFEPALLATFDVTVTDSTFSNNGGDGMAIYAPWDFDVDGSPLDGNPVATVTGSVFSNNGGSGLHIEYGRSVTLDEVTAENNGNYGVYIDYSRNVTVSNSDFADNGNSGLKVWSRDDDATSTITGVTSNGNDVGASFAGTVDATITNSTMMNSTNEGIYAYGAALSVVNSTITGSGGAGITVTGGQLPPEGALPGSVLLRHSTVTGNDGHGVYVSDGRYVCREGCYTVPLAQNVAIHHSIVSGNGDTDVRNASEGNTAPNQGTTTVSWSLIDSDSAFAGSNNVADDDPMLGALADNGGDTPTMLPAAGSPAVDAGNPAVAGAPEFDQRGQSRIKGTIDIGAVETQGSTAATTTTTTTTTTPTSGILPPTGGGDRNGLAAGFAALLIGLGAAMSRVTRRRSA